MEPDSPSSGPGGRRSDSGRPPVLPGRTEGIGALGAAGRYAGLGFQFAFSILFFLYVGRWADQKVGTEGLFTLLGVFVGAGAAFYSMYRRLMADQAREEAEAAQRTRERP